MAIYSCEALNVGEQRFQTMERNVDIASLDRFREGALERYAEGEAVLVISIDMIEYVWEKKRDSCARLWHLSIFAQVSFTPRFDHYMRFGARWPPV